MLLTGTYFAMKKTAAWSGIFKNITFIFEQLEPYENKQYNSRICFLIIC
jgi:hypothetical protein